MRQIPITNKPDLFALVDDNDFELGSQYKWYAVQTSAKGQYYAYANYNDNGKKTTISMHTLLINPDRQKGKQIDHCPDHNGLNNCRSNLILCSPKEHSQRHSTNRKANFMAPTIKTGLKQRGLCIDEENMQHCRLMADRMGLSVSAWLRIVINEKWQTLEQPKQHIAA